MLGNFGFATFISSKDNDIFVYLLKIEFRFFENLFLDLWIET